MFVAGRLGPVISKGAVYFTGFVNLDLGLGFFLFSFMSIILFHVL